MRLKPTILSVDDDPNFSKGVEIVLNRLGMNVKSVSTAEEFLEAAKTLQPDLYLIDLQLEKSDGIELVKAIREGRVPNAYIVVISGTKTPEVIAHALELGANDYILKPLDRVLLATKLSQFVQTPEILDHRAEWQAPEVSRVPISLQFDGLIEEVDELGVKFTSATLVPKGTVLKLGSDFFEKVGVKEREYLITVISTWLIPATHSYGAYAEFDSTDPEFFQTLRVWLSQR